MAKRRDFLKLASLPAMAAFGATGPGTLPSVVMDPQKATVTHEPFGDIRVYFSGPTDQVKSMTAGSLLLKPGMSPHPPHQHPEEEFMVITEGAGEISIEGKITSVSPGSMMYVSGNRLHGVLNTGKRPLLFYFYKWKV